jgi:hypothetical protein
MSVLGNGTDRSDDGGTDGSKSCRLDGRTLQQAHRDGPPWSVADALEADVFSPRQR